MKICLIAATSKNGVIGRGGQLPWNLPPDLSHFRQTTTGHPIIMGRKTFESTGMLPNRHNIVVTSNPELHKSSSVFLDFVGSIDEALEICRNSFGNQLIEYSKVFVIGGADIYSQFLSRNLVDEAYITYIDKNFAGDTYFPEFSICSWKKINSRENVYVDYKTGISTPYKFELWKFIRNENQILCNKTEDIKTVK